MISTRSVRLLIDTVVCLTLAKWETVSARFGGYFTTRVIKLREAEQPAPEMGQEVLSQSKRPEVGRFLLQVDRQTKQSYATAEAAEMAGMVIKKGHPIVRVSVYDSVETANKIIELPAGSSPTS
jgi:hypothetical protein